MQNEKQSANSALSRGKVKTRIVKWGLIVLAGIILLVFPWLDIWGENFLSSGSADWYSIWMNSYFRGAVSGLGAVNIYISFMELVRFFMPDPRS